MLTVIRNTYPKHPNVTHAEPGDKVRWEQSRGQKILVRISDNKAVFSRDLISPGQHDGSRPVVGVIASVKTKGYYLEVSDEVTP